MYSKILGSILRLKYERLGKMYSEILGPIPRLKYESMGMRLQFKPVASRVVQPCCISKEPRHNTPLHWNRIT